MTSKTIAIFAGVSTLGPVSHAAIIQVSTFENILSVPELAGATIVATIEFPETGNYVDGGGFAALVADEVGIVISEASTPSLNGSYTPSGGVPGIAFPSGPSLDLSVNNLAGQVPIAFALPGGFTLGLQQWINSTVDQPSIGDPVSISHFESSPPATVASTTVTLNSVTASSSTSTVSIVPEPSTPLLSILAFTGIFIRRQRR